MLQCMLMVLCSAVPCYMAWETLLHRNQYHHKSLEQLPPLSTLFKSRSAYFWTLKEMWKALHLILAPAEWPEIPRVGSQLLQLCASAVWNLPSAFPFHQTRLPKNFQSLNARYGKIRGFFLKPHMEAFQQVHVIQESAWQVEHTCPVSIGVITAPRSPMKQVKRAKHRGRGKCWNKQSLRWNQDQSRCWNKLEILISAISAAC